LHWTQAVVAAAEIFISLAPMASASRVAAALCWRRVALVPT